MNDRTPKASPVHLPPPGTDPALSDLVKWVNESADTWDLDEPGIELVLTVNGTPIRGTSSPPPETCSSPRKRSPARWKRTRRHRRRRTHPRAPRLRRPSARSYGRDGCARQVPPTQDLGAADTVRLHGRGAHAQPALGPHQREPAGRTAACAGLSVGEQG